MTEAYKRGWDAYIENEVNPFEVGSPEFLEFRQGYQDAQGFDKLSDTYWEDSDASK